MRRPDRHFSFTTPRGFTLLEVLVVLTILGFLAAMIAPAVGMLDDLERERLTRKRMDEIRAAILGPEGRFDDQVRPIIGGYVGDMRAWPDLWEARAEIHPNVSGIDWSAPSTLSGHAVGQGPDYLMDPDLVFYRPIGNFTDGRWNWGLPYRKLHEDNATNLDHIGGLETENEGQPRGLWTRYVEDLPVDLSPTHTAPGTVLDNRWKGPYLNPPQEMKPDDAGHWAATDAEYAELQPAWLGSYEVWEDGDYDPASGELGESFDDKESFRLLQTADRLADGWDRALRFFISADPDSPGGTIFWIVSEGPDREGVYPNKGIRANHGHASWITDPDDTMGKAYDESDPKNRDNIVMKLSSRDWKAIFDAENARKTLETEELLDRIRRALVGDAPLGLNTGYTGDTTTWPDLYRWEDNATAEDPTDDFWDNANATTPYTKGQPRGLWTDTPGLSADNLNATRLGIGWRHAYIGAPFGAGADNILRDAWEREILFFKDDPGDALLVLSRGADGLFTFGADTDAAEPSDFTETVNVTAYNPSAGSNADNRHLILRGRDWRQGFFQLDRLVVRNAPLGSTKARFFASDQPPLAGDILTASILTDEDGDLAADDWAQGNTTSVPAFAYSDFSATNATTGGRCLVFWNDANDNDEPDAGENGRILIFPVTAVPGSGQVPAIILNTATDFGPLP